MIILYPAKLITVPTAYGPAKYQISIFNSGIKLGNFFLRVDPVLLPFLLNAGVKIGFSGLFVSFNASKFYGNRFVQRENVDRITLDASGFNLSLGYSYRNLTGVFFFREYGTTQSAGVSAGMVVKPVIAEAGFDSFEKIRLGAGILVETRGFFIKLGAFSSTRLLKDRKFFVVPVINMGYRR